MTEQQIVFQRGPFTVRKINGVKGFEIYYEWGVAANRVARIGYEGHVGIAKAKFEIERRIRANPRLDC
jgi:hypothetical protein